MTVHKPIGSPLLDNCPATLPAQFYYDPAQFEIERKRICARNWIYVGRANDIAPMTVKRLEVAGQALILVKDRDGTLSGFHNTCRHRGAELCTKDAKLGARLITCPYHQWSYDLRGQLVRVPYATPTPDFDKAAHGLFPVHVREWNGFVFVCLADAPPPFESVPDLGIASLDNWPMTGLVTGHAAVKEVACNWKIFWENYNECLHCPGIHPMLCDMVPVYKRGIMAANEAPDWTPDSPAQPVLKPGARTWTMNGQPCGPEFPNLTPAERAAGMTFVTLLPTMFVVAHVDYVRAITVTPLAPERTELKAEWLFMPETLAAKDFDLANVVDFAATVLAEDAAACEINQRGLRSERYTAGTLMPQEFDIHRFHNWVRRNLEVQET
jgi:Rieske 2Fe-2S family protein